MTTTSELRASCIMIEEKIRACGMRVYCTKFCSYTACEYNDSHKQHARNSLLRCWCASE